MATDSVRALGDELPAHGAWVRRLARSLVRDDAAADDLAQDAALSALQRPGSIRGGLAPWLAQVTRNLARRGWRGEARRALREHAAAEAEAQPGADEVAARLELQRLLVEELGALDAPLRHALVRRYFDGWSAARIARASGEPAPTVRWRLQRGLAELRVRLDRRSGSDGTEWRLALLPLCAGARPWPGALERVLETLRPLAGAGAIPGILTMKAASQALAAGTLVAALGLGVWWSGGREDGARETTAGGSPPRGTELQAPAPVAAQPPAAGPAARAALPTTGEPPAAAVPAPSRAARRLAGRTVDEALVPIARARLRPRDAEPERAVHSAADGAFELDLEPDENACTLRIEAEGFATSFLELNPPAAGTLSLGDVILRPGGSVSGRVFGPDGVPFGAATVTVTGPDLLGSIEDARTRGPVGAELVAGACDADGRFELSGIPTGPMRVWAGAPNLRFAVSPPVEVRARETSDGLELRLEHTLARDRIRGVVLSPAGAPVPRADLALVLRAGGGYSSFSDTADEQGRFELVARSGHVLDVRASDPEERWTSVCALGVQPGAQVELRLLEPRWIEVEVRVAEGVPLAELAVRARTPEGQDLATAEELERDPEGARLRLSVPGEPFVVRADARGFALAEQGPLAPESLPESLVLALVPEPGVRGRVLAGGKPLPGARVALHEAPTDLHIDHGGYVALVMPSAEDETVTDADGRFTLKLRRRGTYVVRAEAPGWVAGDLGPRELAPEIGASGLELTLGRGGNLEGLVRMAPGRDPAGVIVALNRGDAFPRTVRSDSEGRFGFEALTPGPWHLARGRMEFDAAGGGTAMSSSDEPVTLPFNCTIVEGETTHRDLDLRDYEPCRVTGTLRVNGAPVADWEVSGWPGGAEAVVGAPPSTATAADGTFELVFEEPGRLRLSFSPPAEAAGSGGGGRIDVLTEIRPGANAWKDDFQLGRLTGRCLSTLPDQETTLFYNSGEDVTPACWLPIRPDASGAYVLPFVPAGRGVIRRHTEGTGGARSRWETLAETEVLARRERVLDVP